MVSLVRVATRAWGPKVVYVNWLYHAGTAAFSLRRRWSALAMIVLGRDHYDIMVYALTRKFHSLLQQLSWCLSAPQHSSLKLLLIRAHNVFVGSPHLQHLLTLLMLDRQAVCAIHIALLDAALIELDQGRWLSLICLLLIKRFIEANRRFQVEHIIGHHGVAVVGQVFLATPHLDLTMIFHWGLANDLATMRAWSDRTLDARISTLFQIELLFLRWQFHDFVTFQWQISVNLTLTILEFLFSTARLDARVHLASTAQFFISLREDWDKNVLFHCRFAHFFVPFFLYEIYNYRVKWSNKPNFYF